MRLGRGELRIVGGEWRSRRLRFPAEPGLRPTPDRLRETLFDWLGDWIVGRRVLDLYAGSGALGLEALSRGAREAVFVERSAPIAAGLRKNLARLDVMPSSRQDTGAPAVLVECADALEFLRATPGRFDLVFVDPPWTANFAAPSLGLLAANPLLAADHRVYLEQPAAGCAGRQKPGAGPPVGWKTLKTARSGDAEGLLLHQEDAAPAAKKARKGRMNANPPNS